MSPIHEKIRNARAKKERILNSQKLYSEIKTLLNLLKSYIIVVEQERHTSRMADICAKCALESKPCCGSEIELKYSPELLTINLLLGIKLPEKGEIDGMCFFLTEKGCCLFVRDVFCINFICDRIKSEIPSEKIRKLKELEGLQLNLQFHLEEILKNI